MKQTTLFVLLIAAIHPAFAHSKMSSQQSQVKMIYADTSSLQASSVQDMLSVIVAVTGLQSSFELKEANVRNMEAAISHKKRTILYNPGFINWVNHVTKDKWGVITLIAHEVGHHLNGHTIRKTGSTPKEELEADEFAGFVLYKLGATLEQAQEVMNFIANPQASSTHPSRSSRMGAIQNGWVKAQAAVGNAVSRNGL